MLAPTGNPNVRSLSVHYVRFSDPSLKQMSIVLDVKHWERSNQIKMGAQIEHPQLLLVIFRLGQARRSQRCDTWLLFLVPKTSGPEVWNHLGMQQALAYGARGRPAAGRYSSKGISQTKRLSDPFEEILKGHISPILALASISYWFWMERVRLKWTIKERISS